MIFDCSLVGSAGSLVAMARAEGAESFVLQLEGFVAVGIGGSAAEGFVWSGAKGFGGTSLADFVDCHPNPLLHVLLHFCKGGSVVPTCNPLLLVWGAFITLGIAATWGGASVFMVGADVGTWAGGIGQSFLVSNRFSEVDPALGQGVPCLTGALVISSKGGESWTEGCPPFWGLAVGLETSANCPVASLCIVTGTAVVANHVVCIWVDVVAVIGAVVVGMGWFRTLTLYPLLVITVLFLLSHALGLVLGCDCVCCGQFCVDWIWDRDLGFGPSLPSNSR